MWAEHALDDLRRARWRASTEQASSPIDSLTMEMTHFVVTLHAFVSERMLHVAWKQLLQVCYAKREQWGGGAERKQYWTVLGW